MAYDKDLVERVRARVHLTDGIVELKMFGGWGATVHGNMAVGVMGTDLIVRVGPTRFDQCLAKPGVRPFDFTGRPMAGWVFVDAAAIANGRAFNAWVDRGVAYAESLPPKTVGAKSSRRR